MDFAERAHNASYKLDPIVRSLADTDFYKFSMGQFIQLNHFNDRVCFALTNRTKDVRLADLIDIEEFREQLDHVRTLHFERNIQIWLQGQTFYGVNHIFAPGFIDFLGRLKLPDYELSVDEEAGQFIFRTEGRWAEVTWWEIYVLAILSELRGRKVMAKMSKTALRVMFSRAIAKLYAKLERLNELDDLNFSEFGTRRRFGFLWQEFGLLMAKEVLGSKLGGTSNCFLAFKHSLEARGTNAHELPMVYAAKAQNDAELKQSQYEVLRRWQNMDHYREALLIALPDTFGTTQFLRDAPEWLRLWAGARPDSKEPIAAGEELIDFWQFHGQDPLKKLTLWADGLDVHLPGYEPNGADIPTIHNHFEGRTRRGFAMGTMFTNDFIGCPPGDPYGLKPLSLVCKVESVNGHPAVKLSDNPSKATGPKDEVARYLRVFGTEGQVAKKVLV